MLCEKSQTFKNYMLHNGIYRKYPGKANLQRQKAGK